MALRSSFAYQVMVVQLKVESGKLTFDPPFRELRDILLRLLTDIVQNAEDLPRVCLSFYGTYSLSSTSMTVISSDIGELVNYDVYRATIYT